MKTNIKMRVTPEQSKAVQEICFKNNIAWHGVKAFDHLIQPYIYVYENNLGYDCKESSEYFDEHENIEIDADLFIRTNGTCEESIGSKFQPSDEVIRSVAKVNGWDKLETSHYTMNMLLDKLKKKNEILKKARIKRKNQREELHKLNLKLQKCISLEAHNLGINTKNTIIKQLENENYLNKSKLHLSSLNNVSQQKEIEKLKSVIEYLESKAK